MIPVVFVLLACSLEITGALAWLKIPADTFAFEQHAAASMLLGGAITAVLRKEPATRRMMAGLLVSLVPLFMPVVGAVGVSALLLIVLSRAQGARDERWRLTRIPGLPSRVQGAGGRVAGSAMAAVRHGRTIGRRLQALLVTRPWPDAEARPVLAAALRDTADEVRLLAYALLQGREKALYDRIAACRTNLEKAEGARRAHLLRALARHHWELIEAGFAEGAVRLHTIETALQWIEEGLTLAPKDGVMHLLHARLLLEFDRLSEAASALEQASACGLPQQAIAPVVMQLQAAQRAVERTRQAQAAIVARSAAARTREASPAHARRRSPVPARRVEAGAS